MKKREGRTTEDTCDLVEHSSDPLSMFEDFTIHLARAAKKQSVHMKNLPRDVHSPPSEVLVTTVHKSNMLSLELVILR